jgi:hypothetical protein
VLSGEMVEQWLASHGGIWPSLSSPLVETSQVTGWYVERAIFAAEKVELVEDCDCLSKCRRKSALFSCYGICRAQHGAGPSLPPTPLSPRAGRFRRITQRSPGLSEDLGSSQQCAGASLEGFLSSTTVQRPHLGSLRFLMVRGRYRTGKAPARLYSW